MTKEFVYHVSEEEKLPLVLNKIYFSKNRIVLFIKDRQRLNTFFDYFKDYAIPYSHLYTANQNLSFKNFNEGKSKVFLISDENIESKSFYIYNCDEVIHYDIPSHPINYSKRNEIIKNQEVIKKIHLYCNEREHQDLKAIEVYFDKKFIVGKIIPKHLELPKFIKKPKKGQTKKVARKKEKIHKSMKKEIKRTIPTKKEVIIVESQAQQQEPWWKRILNRIKSIFGKSN
ncbi:MAG: helicase-related protein [Leptospiraceae bacterium]|nr:helicase-related protein [Leptospiraceae bacterium]MDW7976326.1 helicase-related protein [Leptospiraceae bacterium]